MKVELVVVPIVFSWLLVIYLVEASLVIKIGVINFRYNVTSVRALGDLKMIC